MDRKPGPYAPDRLELVRGFVNTLDIEAGTDALADVAAWREWATSRDVTGSADDGELTRLRALREHLRDALLANHDRGPLPEQTRAELDEALRWSRATPVLSADGLRLDVPGDGPRWLAGTVVATVAAALSDGTWSRLKACRNDACRWAFYDHSRSRTGQWCSMEICGNRTKQARWRERRGAPG